MQSVLALSEKLTPRTPRTPRIPDTPRATCRTLAARGYKLLERLDGGNYGVIHTGVHIPSREPLIIKELDATGQFQELATREADMMQVAHHRHVVKLYDRIELDSRLFLVMQYARGGDLHDHIIKSPEGYLSVLEAKRIFAQMVMALSNMHKQHAIHVDIKPDNIFLDDNHNVLLGDFGLSDQFKPKARETVARGGTLHYSAPETFLGQMIEGPELDIWSAGAVLYVMMRGRYPFWGESDSEIAHAIMFLEPFWPEWFPEDAIDLLRKIFTKNPRKRISMSKLKRHPFIHQEVRALKREASKKSTRKASRKSSASA